MHGFGQVLGGDALDGVEIGDGARHFQDAIVRAGAGVKMPIDIVAAEYWPLPWYLREYENVCYWGHMIDTHAPTLICVKTDA